MEINRTSAAQPQRPIDAEQATAPSAAGPDETERRDRIELSDAARAIGQQSNAAREARMQALRAQLDAGTYRMDADGVARRIVARQDL